MTDHRTPLNPSQNKFSYITQYSTTPQNSTNRPTYQNHPLTNRPLSRRITPSPSPILIQENVSEPKKPQYKTVSRQNVNHDVLKFSKNFPDTKKPPMNPLHIPTNSASGNEILGHQPRESPRRTVCDLTLANLQLHHLPMVDSRTPKMRSDNYRTSTSKDNRYGREVASNAEFKYNQKEGNHVDLNIVSRNLRTEGDMVVYRTQVSRGNSSENVMRRNSAVVPAQVNDGKTRGKKFSGTLRENQVSDDVQYGAGGVGYSAGGKREKTQEGEPLEWGNEKRRSHAQSSADKRVICVEKETLNKWKHDISEIRRDIEKRKKSYEKVEKFITMHVHHKQRDNSGEIKRHETLPSFAGYSHHSSTGPTLATMQTQPAQPGFERIISPSFSSDFPYVSQPTPLFGPDRRRGSLLQEQDSSRFDKAPLLELRRNGREGLKTSPILQENEYLFENEREKYLCKAACCERDSGCQMF